jgi:light-harvesting complex 1 beta chain
MGCREGARKSRALLLIWGYIGGRSMSDNERFGPGAYLTPEEAKEFHKLFVSSFITFTGIAIVAHLLVWFWRPWF